MRKAIALLFLVSAPAYADFTYDFSGAIDYGGWNGYAAGTPITGSYTIASNAPPNGSPGNGPGVTSYDAVKSMTFHIVDDTFSLATDWTWTVNDSAFSPSDSQGAGSVPVNSANGAGGEAFIEYVGGTETFDGTDLSLAGSISDQPWSVKRWGMEIYQLGADAAVQVTEFGGEIFQTMIRPDSIASVPPTHDQYGTYIGGTMKDGYPPGSD